jgi:catechol 2,3-dioxygenase-like lactoylglutathione lyase family enzyme
MLKLNGLDHVAITVRDLDASVAWYERVLGLKRYAFEEWGPFPVFMLAGRSGLAIFPTGSKDAKEFPAGDYVHVKHFAFNVDGDNFRRAQDHLRGLAIPFEFQDHQFFHSIYFRDPDGHQVELTTIVVDAASFYQ